MEITQRAKENRFLCKLCDAIPKPKPKQTQKTVRVFRRQSIEIVDRQMPEPGNDDDSLSSGGEDFDGFSPQRDFIPIQLRPRELVVCSVDGYLNEPSSASARLDASKWTTKEVYDFFKDKFPRHAHVFEDEEIDGAALYRLQRDDVVKRFKIKLGPALKIYDFILKLQDKNN